MKPVVLFIALAAFNFAGCRENKKSGMEHPVTAASADSVDFLSGYSEVNGIKMYYEIYGEGKPLVLLHGGGSTIQTSFGRIIPALAVNRQVIGVELQAHGRTGDRNSGISFEQDADDVAALLKNLGIRNADFFGFSNGATTVLQIAIRHPDLADKIISASPLCKRSGAPAQFWHFMKQATLEMMPQPYKDAYKKVAPNPGNLRVMNDKCVKRMTEFKDMTDGQLASIKAPVLIVSGDRDVLTPEHALELHRLIANSRLAVIPGGHGEYIGEITTLKPGFTSSDFIIPLLEKFLNEK